MSLPRFLWGASFPARNTGTFGAPATLCCQATLFPHIFQSTFSPTTPNSCTDWAAVGFICHLHLVDENWTGPGARLFHLLCSWDAQDSMGKKEALQVPLVPEVCVLKDSTAQLSPCELVNHPSIGQLFIGNTRVGPCTPCMH